MRGLGQTSLIADWPAIVGETLARHARPIELQWPPRAAKRNPDAPIAPATLVLRVESAFALEAQHSAPVIVARANAHLGWRCVDRIAFRQGPLPPLKEKRRAAPLPSGAAEAAAREAASPIADEGLREALTRLGARAIDRSGRLRARGGRPNPEGGLRRALPPSARRPHDPPHERGRQRHPRPRPARLVRPAGAGGRARHPSRAGPRLRSDDGARRSEDRGNRGRCAHL